MTGIRGLTGRTEMRHSPIKQVNLLITNFRAAAEVAIKVQSGPLFYTFWRPHEVRVEVPLTRNHSEVESASSPTKQSEKRALPAAPSHLCLPPHEWPSRCRALFGSPINPSWWWRGRRDRRPSPPCAAAWMGVKMPSYRGAPWPLRQATRCSRSRTSKWRWSKCCSQCWRTSKGWRRPGNMIWSNN